MAKKKDAAEGEDGAKKKKPIKPIIIVVLALVGVKMFVLKEPAPTEAEKKAAELAAEQELYNTCAEANGRETLGDLVEGGKDPGTKSESTTESEHASAGPAGTITYQLVSGGGGGSASGEGPIVSNESSVTVNLQDGSYLKLGLAIQLAPGQDAKLVEEEGLIAKATDATLKALAKHDIEELFPVKARNEIQDELSFDMCRDTEATILKIYFTEFVMQEPS